MNKKNKNDKNQAPEQISSLTSKESEFVFSEERYH